MKLALEVIHSLPGCSIVSVLSVHVLLLSWPSVVLGNNLMKLVQRTSSSCRNLVPQFIDLCSIELCLLGHLVAKPFDVLLLSLQLLVLLLDHILQGLHGLIGSILNLLLFFLCDSKCFEPVVFNCILEHKILAQVLVTFLPHAQATNFTLFRHELVLHVLQLLLELGVLGLHALQFDLGCQILASRLLGNCHGTLLILNSIKLSNIDASGLSVRQSCCSLDTPSNFALTTSWTLASHVDIILVLKWIKAGPEELTLATVIYLTILFLDAMDITLELRGSLFKLEHVFVLGLDESL